MNLSPIATATVFSCAVHIGALAVFAHTNRPPELTKEIVFSSTLQATLIQETQDAGETIEPSVSAIETVETKQIDKASQMNERLQDLLQQATELQKRVALQQTQQLALRNNLDRETAQNNLLRETQRSLRDQLTSLQATNRLQTESIAALEGQTALAVNQSQVLLQQHETLRQTQYKTEDARAQLQTETASARIQHAQASSLLKLREDQLAQSHQDVKSLQQSNSELVDRNQTLATDFSRIEIKHNALSGQNNNLRQHLETANQKNSILSAEQQVLTENYLRLKEVHDQAQNSEISALTQLQQSSNTINTLSVAIEHMQSEQVTLKNQLDTLGQLNRHLEDKLITRNSAINTIRNEHRLELEQIAVQQTNTLQEVNAVVTQERDQLKIATKALQTTLARAARDNQSLAEDRVELRTENRLLKKQLTELTAINKELDQVISEKPIRTETPRPESQTASTLPTQQASRNLLDTGNAAVDYKPRPVAGNPKPHYPLLARNQGIEGRVVVNVLISVQGTVKTIGVGQSSGSRLLDKAAVQAVKKWRFHPVLHNGKAIPSSETVPIIFKLKDS